MMDQVTSRAAVEKNINLVSKDREMNGSMFVVIIHSATLLVVGFGFRLYMANLIMERALDIFRVVRATLLFGILRTEFGVFFFVIRKDNIKMTKIVMESVVTVIDGLIIIETFMELNHNFLGLAGLEDSRRSRIPER